MPQGGVALECRLLSLERTKNMTRLIILTIAMAMTPTVYAAKDIDREKHNYHCSPRSNPQLFEKVCKGLKKGDRLGSVNSFTAVLYCDKDELILPLGTDSFGLPLHACVYNGREIKKSKRVN